MIIDRAVAHEERFGQTRIRFMVGLRHESAGPIQRILANAPAVTAAG